MSARAYPAYPTPSVTRSSTASSLSTLLTPENSSFPPNIHIEGGDGGGSATPTRNSFFTTSKKDSYAPLRTKLASADLRRSVSARTPGDRSSRRARPTLAMSIHCPATTPSVSRSSHGRRPSLSETMLRDIVQRDEERRGINSSSSSIQSEHEPKPAPRHRRRHSTSVHPAPTTPHTQVLQARLERVMGEASDLTTRKSPSVFSRSPSSNPRRRGSVADSKRSLDDDNMSLPPLEPPRSASPYHQAPTTPNRKKRHSMPNTPQHLDVRQRPSLTGSPRLQPSSPRHPHFSLHPNPPASPRHSPFLRPTSPPSSNNRSPSLSSAKRPGLVLLTPPSTPPGSPPPSLPSQIEEESIHTMESSSSSSNASSSDVEYSEESSVSPTTRDGFNPRLASITCRSQTGYVSFGEIEGLDATGLCGAERDCDGDGGRGMKQWKAWLKW